MGERHKDAATLKWAPPLLGTLKTPFQRSIFSQQLGKNQRADFSSTVITVSYSRHKTS